MALIQVGILDGLTPAVQRWVTDLNPGSRRALMDAGRRVADSARDYARSTFRRTGRNRVLKGDYGIKVAESRAAGIPAVRIWHSSGLLAAHELGSTIPAATLAPTRKRVLAWGGPPGGPHTHFSRGHSRRAFTLRRRPTLEPAYEYNAETVLQILEREYQAILDQAPPAVRTA